ncbi:MAG TPA: Ig-like domain-containing protein [Stenotrophomonas sp.]|jgi:VCBS repeat-containing protein
MSIQIVRKSDGASRSVDTRQIALDQPSLVKLALDPQAVARYERVGEDLLLVLKDGTTITVGGFFVADAQGQHSDLVVQDATGTNWRGDYDAHGAGFHLTELPAEPAAADAGGGDGMPTWAMTLLGVAGAGALVAASSGGGGGHETPPPTPPPPPPPAPTITVLSIAHAALLPGDDSQLPVTVSGRSTGQYVTVTWQDADGHQVTSAVLTVANGTWSLEVARSQLPEADFAKFVATVTDGAGHAVLVNGASISDTEQAVIEHRNDPPLTDAHGVSTLEDTPVSGTVHGSDPEGLPVTYLISIAPLHGTLQLDAQTGAYTYTPHPDFNGEDTFRVAMSDGRDTSVLDVPVTVVSQNDAPETADQAFSVTEDTVLHGVISSQDHDGDVPLYGIAQAPTHGSVTLDPASGTYVYTPEPNYNGPDRFVVSIDDGHGAVVNATVEVTVSPSDDPPVAQDQALSTNEDIPLLGTILASDIEGDPFTFWLDANPAHGSVTLDAATGAFTYTPAGDFHGSDQFTVVILDGKGTRVFSTVTVEVLPTNDAPVVSDQHFLGFEDLPITGRVAAIDVEGDPVSFAIAGNPAHGSVVINALDGTFTYVPTTDFNGNDHFSVTVSDNQGGSTTRTVFLQVISENDAPVAEDLTLTTLEDQAVSGTVVATDVEADTLSYSIFNPPSHGTLTVDPVTGAFIYTPEANYHGGDDFIIGVQDGNGLVGLSHAHVDVLSVNDAPISSDLSLTTSEGAPLVATLVASDPDGDTLSFNIIGAPTHGTLVLNTLTGQFTYSPMAGYHGADSFVVSVSDGQGSATSSTVNLQIEPINQAPVANDDIAIVDQGASVMVAVRTNDSDADGDALTVVAVTQGANGSVVIDGVTGNPLYTPNAGFVGADTFSYTVSDGHGATATAMVAITAVVPNDAPVSVADAITVAEGGTTTLLSGGATSLLSNDSDADGDPLTAVLVSGPAHGALVLNANGTFSYTHNGSETTQDSFTYHAYDGQETGNVVTVAIAVTPVNDAPVAQDDYFTINEDQALALPLPYLVTNDTDADGDSLSVISVSNPVNGVMTLTDGILAFTPNANFNGMGGYSYTAYDGKGGTSTATVHIQIGPVEDAPTGVADHITVAEGSTAATLTGGATSLLANDSDADGDPLSAVLVSGPLHGTLFLSADGHFSYTHDGTPTATDSFVYRPNDGLTDGNDVTVSIDITQANSAFAAVAAFDFAALASASVPDDGLSPALPALHDVLGSETHAGADPLAAWLGAGIAVPAGSTGLDNVPITPPMANPLDDLESARHMVHA